MAKKLLIHQTKKAFHAAKKHTWMEKIMAFPTPIRYLIGIGLILFGILGILTPIPFGIVFLLIGFIIFRGIAKTRNTVFRVIYWLRLHIHYGKIYTWWKHRK